MSTENRLIERAVDLWCRKLRAPIFNNGDDSREGDFGAVMATLNIEAAQRAEGDLDSKIEVFRAKLISILVDKKVKQSQRRGYFWAELSTDYAPEEDLADAAKEAGINYKLFSVKSSVYINSGYVTSSFGYGDEQVNHYPLENGGWLITTLSGGEMDKVIASVAKGNPLGLKVEHQSATDASDLDDGLVAVPY